MPIYTRTGDKGQTSLYGGIRVPKYSLRVETYGTVDELNSILGLTAAEISARGRSSFGRQSYQKKLLDLTLMVQNDLLELGSMLANPTKKQRHTKEEQEYLQGVYAHVKEFEKEIDFMTEKMPELSNFILPGGGRVGALYHHARTVCRRVERRVVELSQKEEVYEEIIKYFNRLSDLLFTMARFANYAQKKKEHIWKVT